LLVSLFWPGARGEGRPWRLIILAFGLEIIFLLYLRWGQTEEIRTSVGDITGVIFAFLLIWHLATGRTGLLDPMLFPAPDTILALLIREIPDLFRGLGSSLALLASGYAIALVTAVPLGLLIGWRGRLFRVVNPFTKVLGPIPPIVYIPYAIALLPSFRTASIFVIFVGAFWPIFINTISGVFNIPKGLIDTARVLNLKERALLYRVILPGALPSICAGATLALIFAFVLLTAAELIGATSGIGWYVKNFSDFSDFQRVIVGIFFISLVVTAITWGTERLERFLLRWRI
ncbi:MAG: ABC transporter permease, partial [Deltaproteobacteria bacterium]|nr:ABC transporter permease [Deltaproteobacteria bacterium]